MRRFINGLIILILAAALTAGSAYLYDRMHQKEKESENTAADVTSGITGRIYALDDGTDTAGAFIALGDTADAYAQKKLASSGGGSYTDSSGSYHYVPPSYGGGGGGSDDGGYSGGGGGSGGGGSSGGGSGGSETTYDIDIDDTEYNICHACGTEYTGTGGCPNPNCEAYHPGEF